jgi:hypothetical protein
MGWVARSQGLQHAPHEYAKLTHEQVLDLVAKALRLGLPMQAEARGLLIEAIEGLKAGQVVPLFRKTGKRRGVAPQQSAQVELRMLMWVRWQHGLGRKIYDAETELEVRAEVSRQAIRKWPAELGKVYGKAKVASALERAEAIGRAEKLGKDRANFSHEPLEHQFGLWSVSWWIERDLSILVKKRNAATAKRSSNRSERRVMPAISLS